MKKLYLLTLTFLTFGSSWGQALVNNLGADVYITQGAFVIVKTSSVRNLQGSIENAGQFVIEGDIQNDANLLGGSNTATGYYKVQGDWINNANVTSYLDTVHLYGNNQLITGNTPTNFYNLILTGSPTAIKTQTLDAYVNGVLELNDVELATDQSKMIVVNPSQSAILNSTTPGAEGFVSSVGNGRLVRYTNSALAYNFPLGTPSSTGNPFYFRPLDIKPQSGNTDSWEAMIAKDPTADSYDVNILDNQLCRVNPLYYHRIDGISPADMKFYYNSSVDGRWTDVGHWVTNQWNYTSVATSNNSGGFSSLEIKGWNNYTPDPFALASKKFLVDAGPNTAIYPGQSVPFNPTIGTNSVSSITWTPSTYLDFDNIRNPNSTPDKTVTYVVNVTDATGCKVSDTVQITVKADDLLIPSAFSPNNDGMNDVFRTLSTNLAKYRMLVFNRWGEKVYETEDPAEGWDGTYKGIPQDIGVYVYTIDYQTFSSTILKTMSGNVTLVK